MASEAPLAWLPPPPEGGRRPGLYLVLGTFMDGFAMMVTTIP